MTDDLKQSVERINEALKSHETIYRTLLIVCAIGLSTINSFSDMDLIVNGNHSTNLPLLNAALSSKAFLWLMPLFITVLYIYYILLTEKCEELYENAERIRGEFDIYNYTYSSLGDSFRQFCDKASEVELKSSFNSVLLKPVIYWLFLFVIQPFTQFAIIIMCLRKHDYRLTAFQITTMAPPLYFAIFVACHKIPKPRNKEDKIAFLTNIILTLLLLLNLVSTIIWPLYIITVEQLSLSKPLVDLFTSRSFVRPFSFTSLILCVLSILLINEKFLQSTIAKIPSRFKFAALLLTISFMISGSLIIFSASNPMLSPVRTGISSDSEEKSYFSISQNNILAFALMKLNCNAFLDLRNAFISSTPHEWSGEAKDMEKQILNVRGADLEGLDLRGADMERAFLGRANLRGADLRGAYLRGANFMNADLRGAKLENAFIRLANFRNADLRNVDFGSYVYIQDWDNPTYLYSADFQGARFELYQIMRNESFFPFRLLNSRDRTSNSYYTINLPLAFFGLQAGDWDKFKNENNKSYIVTKLEELEFPALTDSELRTKTLTRQVTFPNAFSLEGAFFDKFDLTNAIFDHTYLYNASFKSANLKNVTFKCCDLRNTDFTGANLESVDFTGSNLTGAIFDKCINIENATFPPEFSYLNPKKTPIEKTKNQPEKE